DDLNTPRALAVLFDAAREINRQLGSGSADPAFLTAARALFADFFAGVLGLAEAAPHAAAPAVRHEVLPGVMELLLAERRAARLNRDFAASDRIRDRLAELGIVIEDTAAGSRWRLRENS